MRAAHDAPPTPGYIQASAFLPPSRQSAARGKKPALGDVELFDSSTLLFTLPRRGGRGQLVAVHTSLHTVLTRSIIYASS